MKSTNVLENLVFEDGMSSTPADHLKRMMLKKVFSLKESLKVVGRRA